MKKRQKERLKDIIIDHIYDYCYNEVVKKIKGDSANITLDAHSKIEDDPLLQSIFDNLIKPSKSIKMVHDKRNENYCKVIEGNVVHKSFMDKLLSQGFNKSKKLNEQIETALNFLVYRSYLARNLPIQIEFTLTPKGINHYTSGRSFEELYIKERNTRIALTISIISIFIAFCAFAYNLISKGASK